MRKIDKRGEPRSLQQWKRENPGKTYKDLEGEAGAEIRKEIRKSCTEEQFYLCAYCCREITGEQVDTVNEHVKARKLAPEKTLDYSNIVASCKTPGQCDASHGSQPISLTPLMHECETELSFRISGGVVGKSKRAEDAIQVLGLRNRSLIQIRKQMAESVLWSNAVDPGEGLEDDDLIQLLVDDLSHPEAGKLAPYAPVVINILRGWFSDSSRG